MLDTAKELSDLSQRIALSTTSAELVEQELKRCRKKERESRWEDVRQGGRVFHGTPFQPRPVVGPLDAVLLVDPNLPARVQLVAEVLQDIGKGADARVPSPEVAQVLQDIKKRADARVLVPEESNQFTYI